MELIGVKEEKIKIKKTIFNMEPRLETTTKISRNVDSGTTQLQQVQTLTHTLLRLEAIRANAYERWQPFFNQTRLDFPGLLAYLNVFHDDQETIEKLDKYFQTRKMIIAKLKSDRENPNLVERFKKWKTFGNELMDELRQKISELQLTAKDFQVINI